MKPHYRTLEVPETATQEEIKKSFNRLSKIHHPDKGGDPEKQKDLNEAYDCLSDPERRANYDEYGTDTKPKSIEQLADEELIQVFREIIRVEFQINTLFKLMHDSVKHVLIEAEERKRQKENQKRILEYRLEKVKSLLTGKVKPSMKILTKVILEEVENIEYAISKMGVEEIGREIKVHKKVLKILNSGYPAEEVERRIDDMFLDQFKNYAGISPTQGFKWK